MIRKMVSAAVILICLAPALQAEAMKLCQDGAIEITIRTMKGVALIGTAGPMPCDGIQTAMVTGMYWRTENGYVFSLSYDQVPSETCLEGWEAVGNFKDGAGQGYWFNTVEFPVFSPVSLTIGPCPTQAGEDAVLLHPVPGAVQ
jgi:hypothetical protein